MGRTGTDAGCIRKYGKSNLGAIDYHFLNKGKLNTLSLSHQSSLFYALAYPMNSKDLFINNMEQYHDACKQHPYLDTGIQASIFVLGLSYLLRPFNMSDAQQALQEINSHIHMFAVPRRLYETLILNQDVVNTISKSIIKDVVVPHFDNNCEPLVALQPTECFSHGHTHALWSTVNQQEQELWHSLFGMTEEENLENLKDVGIPVAEMVMKDTLRHN